MWTINVVDEKEDSMQIDIRRDGVAIDARDITEILNCYEKRIADLAVKNEDLINSNCSLASSNTRLAKNYYDMEKDYRDMHKNLSAKIDEKHRAINNLTTKLSEFGENSVRIEYMNEDELPINLRTDIYSAMYKCSKLDFVRLFPFVTIDGRKLFLIDLEEGLFTYKRQK